MASLDRSSTLLHYVRTGRTSVEGWLSRCDAEILRTLLRAQDTLGVSGSVAEIGVHHGKSFILLALANGGRGYVIDVFGQQSLNIDRSGSGDEAAFLSNLRRFGLRPEDLVIDRRMSQEVSARDLRESVGPVRLFHIDGAHHYEAVRADIHLAVAAIGAGGVIVLDDVFRPEWPEVSMALFEHLSHSRELCIFAIGFNKTYLCEPAFAQRYRDALLMEPLVAMNLCKRYQVARDEVLVFQTYPLPEWTLTERLAHDLKVRHPDLALTLLRARGWLKRKRGT